MSKRGRGNGNQEIVRREPDENDLGGFVPFPNLAGDEQLVSGITDYVLDKNFDPEPRYSDERVSEWIKQYSDFVKQPDTMPRAHETASRIGRRLVFEKAWRAGYYSKAPDDITELVDKEVDINQNGA